MRFNDTNIDVIAVVTVAVITQIKLPKVKTICLNNCILKFVRNLIEQNKHENTYLTHTFNNTSTNPFMQIENLMN